MQFQDGSFKDPLVARYVSDGTIKMFAYLLLLHDPRTHPLLCIEEPENQLHPELLRELAEEFRSYSERGGQVFIATHLIAGHIDTARNCSNSFHVFVEGVLRVVGKVD